MAFGTNKIGPNRVLSGYTMLLMVLTLLHGLLNVYLYSRLQMLFGGVPIFLCL